MAKISRGTFLAYGQFTTAKYVRLIPSSLSPKLGCSSARKFRYCVFILFFFLAHFLFDCPPKKLAAAAPVYDTRIFFLLCSLVLWFKSFFSLVFCSFLVLLGGFLRCVFLVFRFCAFRSVFFSSSSSADGGNGNESDESEFEEGSSVGHEERLKLKILLQLIKNMAKKKPRVVSRNNRNNRHVHVHLVLCNALFRTRYVFWRSICCAFDKLFFTVSHA